MTSGAGAWRRTNYRGRPVSLAAGPLVVLGLLAGAVLAGSWALGLAASLAGLAGLYDDLRGDATAKGLAGHFRAVRHGRVTSGLVKVVVVGVAGLVAGAVLHGWPRLLLTAALVAGTANLVNLFDLRPGRALKVVLLGALPVASALGLVVGAVALAALPWDLRERTMLGDGGANALGAALGVAVAARLPGAAAAAVLVLVVALTLASERVSFSRVIDAVPPLRWADRLGRAA